MPRVDVVDMNGAKVGEMELDDSVFGVDENEHLMHMAVRMHLDKSRVGTADTKTRGEVSGGGRKPWRQKGTGRARHGSIRSPLWRKGGVAFGPHPREFGFEMPKRQRRLALKSALSSKLRSGEIIVVDELRLEQPKTREMVRVLSNLKAGRTALVVTAVPDRAVVLSSRNVPGVTTLTAPDLNVYDVLVHERVVLTKDAARRVEEVLGAS